MEVNAQPLQLHNISFNFHQFRFLFWAITVVPCCINILIPTNRQSTRWHVANNATNWLRYLLIAIFQSACAHPPIYYYSFSRFFFSFFHVKPNFGFYSYCFFRTCQPKICIRSRKKYQHSRNSSIIPQDYFVFVISLRRSGRIHCIAYETLEPYCLSNHLDVQRQLFK